MGIFDAFKAAPAPAAPVTQPSPSNNDGGQGSKEPVNPLDIYSKMYDTSNNSSEEGPPSFKLNDEVLTKVTGQLKFVSGVDPALMQKATTGDVNALLEVMNAVGQNAYKAAISHSTALTDTHLNNRAEHEQKVISGKVKEQLITSSLADIPNFNHPVIKAELVRIATGLAKQNPDATPEQIKTEAVRYFQEVQAALAPTTKTQGTNPGRTAGEIDDWEAFLTS